MKFEIIWIVGSDIMDGENKVSGKIERSTLYFMINISQAWNNI